ncbi:POLQ1 [Auxenochlorella protothecoides x Auxenochlorella symbiontica]
MLAEGPPCPAESSAGTCWLPSCLLPITAAGSTSTASATWRDDVHRTCLPHQAIHRQEEHVRTDHRLGVSSNTPSSPPCSTSLPGALAALCTPPPPPDTSWSDVEEDTLLQVASLERRAALSHAESGVGGPPAPSPPAGTLQPGLNRACMAQPVIKPDSSPSHDLRAYLPGDVAEVYLSSTMKGANLYEWQAEALALPGVLQGGNFVYSAPTSGGKSLVADVLMLRSIIASGRPAMLVLPFVSLCAEKAAHYQRLLAPLKKEVCEAYGAKLSQQMTIGPNTGIIVCTIEKANILVNRLLAAQALDTLSCLVVDELHMVGDQERGYQLELLLTKLMYTAVGSDNLPLDTLGHQDLHGSLAQRGLRDGLQIVGMSATLPNLDVVARWLRASLYQTTFRPIVLKQYIMVDGMLEVEGGETVRHVARLFPKEEDPDFCATLAQEIVSQGHSVVVFCGTKKACETVALKLARLLKVPQRARSDCGGMEQRSRTDVAALLGQLSASDTCLAECVRGGVAFHHSALSSEERQAVEGAFRAGSISVLAATSTLAAGVNLPARRVIFKQAYQGLPRPENLLTPTQYRQMAGRAGRAGVDAEGDSILLTGTGVTLHSLRALVRAPVSPIASCLTEDRKGMKRAMLEVVATGVVTEPSDVQQYIRCTLLAHMNSSKIVAATTVAALQWLGREDHAFVTWDRYHQVYRPSPLGCAALVSGFPPERCMAIHADLQRARECIVLTSDLHLTFLCVSPTDDLIPDWRRLLQLVNSLQGADANVASHVGLNLGAIMARAHGYHQRSSGKPEEMTDSERVGRRFWAALILRDVLAEVDLQEISRKFGAAQGAIQGLQERSSRFASMLAAFCERLQWQDLEMLVSKFQARVLQGVRPELLALTEIPFVRNYTARKLYSAGLRSPDSIAALEDETLLIEILARGSTGSASALQSKRAAREILLGARNIVSAKRRGVLVSLAVDSL